MPGGFPLGLDICNVQSVAFTESSTKGTNVVAGSSANTMGSWTQLVSSLSSDACWCDVQIGDSSASSANSFAVDIGVGAAASEQVIAQLYSCGTTNFSTTPTHLMFPLCVPAGTRVSARAQSATGSNTCDVAIRFFDGGFTHQEGAAGVDRIGFVSASSVGTTVAPSATANTKGSFTQLIASTAVDYIGLLWETDTLNTAPTASSTYFMDLAIGGSGSEQVIVPVWCVITINGDKQTIPYGSAFYPILIPAGTRLSARLQCSAASQPSLGVVLMGVYQ